jgi:hypothetical protein
LEISCRFSHNLCIVSPHFQSEVFNMYI